MTLSVARHSFRGRFPIRCLLLPEVFPDFGIQERRGDQRDYHPQDDLYHRFGGIGHSVIEAGLGAGGRRHTGLSVGGFFAHGDGAQAVFHTQGVTRIFGGCGDRHELVAAGQLDRHLIVANPGRELIDELIVHRCRRLTGGGNVRRGFVKAFAGKLGCQRHGFGRVLCLDGEKGRIPLLLRDQRGTGIQIGAARDAAGLHALERRKYVYIALLIRHGFKPDRQGRIVPVDGRECLGIVLDASGRIGGLCRQSHPHDAGAGQHTGEDGPKYCFHFNAPFLSRLYDMDDPEPSEEGDTHDEPFRQQHQHAVHELIGHCEVSGAVEYQIRLAVRRQRDAVADSQRRRQRQGQRIHPGLLGDGDDRRDQDGRAHRLTGEDQMAETGNKYHNHKENERADILQAGGAEHLVQEEGSRSGLIERQAGCISAGAEYHQIPRNLGFLPVEDADVGQIKEYGCDDRDHDQADLDAEHLDMIAVRCPEENGQQKDHQGLDFHRLHPAQRFILVFDREFFPVTLLFDRGIDFRPVEKFAEEERHHHRQQSDGHSGQEPLGPADVDSAEVPDIADCHDLGRGGRQNGAGRDIVYLQLLDHEFPAEVAFAGHRFVDLGDHQGNGQDQSRPSCCGGHDESQQEVDGEKRQQRLFRGGPEFGDDKQGQSFGKSGFFHPGGDDECREHQPDDIIAEDPQDGCLIPCAGNGQSDDGDQG